MTGDLSPRFPALALICLLIFSNEKGEDSGVLIGF
jgi:hypothetical protein